MVDRELSIGDYVLTGGELAALVIIDAVLRLLPGRDRRGVDHGGVVRRRPARVPAVHAPGDVRRGLGAPGPRVRPSRAGPAVAAPRVAAPDARAAAGPARGPGDDAGGTAAPR